MRVRESQSTEGWLKVQPKKHRPVSRILRGRVLDRIKGNITSLEGEICHYAQDSFPDLRNGDEVQAHCHASSDGQLYVQHVKLLRRSDEIPSPILAGKFGDDARNWLETILDEIDASKPKK